MSKGFTAFDSWGDVLTYVAEHGSVYYHPPLNHIPVSIAAKVKGKSLRLSPGNYREPVPGRPDKTRLIIQDDFTADIGHLDRMRKTS